MGLVSHARRDGTVPRMIAKAVMRVMQNARETLARLGDVKGPDVVFLAPDTPPEMAETLSRWGEATDEERAAVMAHARKKRNEGES